MQEESIREQDVLEDEYEVDFQQIVYSIDKYMNNVLEKELIEFDKMMKEKTESCPQELVDHDEIENMRELVFKKVRLNMLEKIKNALSEKNFEGGFKIIEKLYSGVSLISH